MAKIPTLGTSETISMNAPLTPTYTPSGRKEKAQMQIADMAGDFAVQLERKRRKAETLDYVTTARREYVMGMEDAHLEAEMDGFDGYESRISKASEERLQRLYDRAPSEEARMTFKNFAEGKALEYSVRAKSKEHKHRAMGYIQSQQAGMEELKKRTMSDPDPFKANENYLQEVESLELSKGIFYTEEQAELLKQDAAAGLRKSWATGMLSQGMPGIVTPGADKETKMKEISSYLDGKVPGTEALFSGMTADEKRTYLDTFSREIDRQDRMRVSETRSVLNSFGALSKSGDLNLNFEEQAASVRSKIDSLSPGVEKFEMEKDFQVKYEVGKVLRDAPFMSENDLLEMDMDKMFPISGVEGAEDSLRARATLASSREAILKARNKDPHGYAMAYYRGEIMSAGQDPVSQINKSIEIQKKLGIERPRVMSNSQALQESASILEGVNADDVAMGFETVRAKYGAHSYQAFMEMAENNKDFDSAYATISHVESPSARKSLIYSLKNKKEIERDFSGSPQMKVWKNSIQSEVETKLKPYLDAFRRSGDETNRTHANNIRDMVITNAKDRLLQGKSTDYRDAVEKASAEAITSVYEPYLHRRNTVFIPRTVASENGNLVHVDTESAKVWMDRSMQPSSLKSLGASRTRYTRFTSDEQFYEHIKDYGFWGPSESGDGVVLYARNMEKLTDPPMVLRDADGVAISRKFTDMDYTKLPKEPLRLMEQDTGFIGGGM